MRPDDAPAIDEALDDATLLEGVLEVLWKLLREFRPWLERNDQWMVDRAKERVRALRRARRGWRR